MKHLYSWNIQFISYDVTVYAANLLSAPCHELGGRKGALASRKF